MLSADHRAMLVALAVDPDRAERVGVRSVTTADDLPDGAPRWFAGHLPGLAFPWTDDDGSTAWQLRPDDPRGGPKYLYPTGWSPTMPRLTESDGPILAVEGTKQALAAASHAEGVEVRALSGCHGWKHADLSFVEGRDVVVVPDADVATNRQVWGAYDQMRRELRLNGATSVAFVSLPASGTDGLDDYLARKPEGRRSKLLSRLVEQAEADLPERPAYGRKPEQVELPLPVPVDFDALLSGDLPEAEWLAGRLFERGSIVSVVGSKSSRKSLIFQHFAVAAATGTSFLGDEPREPVKVLYVDEENAPRDLARRFASMGADADSLGNLHYYSLQSVGALDTKAGAERLLALVELHGAEVVILDTLSRMVEGNENDADSYLQMYRLTFLPLKNLGVALVRLDHTGKDEGKGARGSSAKDQDVDTVWLLSNEPNSADRVRLKRDKNRGGLDGIGDEVVLTITGSADVPGSTRIEAPAFTTTPVDPHRAKVDELVALLDEYDAPVAGRPASRKHLADLNVAAKYGDKVWADAVAQRKARDDHYAERAAEPVPEPVAKTCGDCGTTDGPFVAPIGLMADGVGWTRCRSCQQQQEQATAEREAREAAERAAVEAGAAVHEPEHSSLAPVQPAEVPSAGSSSSGPQDGLRRAIDPFNVSTPEAVRPRVVTTPTKEH